MQCAAGTIDITLDEPIDSEGDERPDFDSAATALTRRTRIPSHLRGRLVNSCARSWIP